MRRVLYGKDLQVPLPQKHVYLANPIAECPMAKQMDKVLIEQIKETHPDYTIMAYVNTTAELKTIVAVPSMRLSSLRRSSR